MKKDTLICDEGLEKRSKTKVVLDQSSVKGFEDISLCDLLP